MTDTPPDAAPSPTRPAVPGFVPASSLPRPPATTSTSGSHRNASGGLPPIPKPVNGTEKPSGEHGEGEDGAAAAKTGPAKPINRPISSKNAIVYNAVQRRNPLLQSIKNVGIEIGDIVADYQVGTHNGALFLSLKYHRLHPEYIHQRIEKMKNMYHLRILLVLCDINEHQQSIRELTKIAVVNEFTMFVAWNNEEVAQYLTTFKAYEHKSADTLKERIHQSYHDQLQHVLTSGKKVNKTDADNLASQFGSFANITKQPAKVLANVKGLGATKVASLVDAFTKPFVVGGLKRDRSESGAPQVIVAAVPEQGATTLSDFDTELGGDETVPGSPDWPENEQEGQEQAEEMTSVDSRRRQRAPSRSPGLSPEPRAADESTEEAWRDPLEDEDDEPASKRAKT